MGCRTRVFTLLAGVLLLGISPAGAQAWWPGDLDCNGAVDFADINALVLALGDPQQYAVLYPGCALANGDLNGDGAANFADINPFVALLAGSGPRWAGQRHSDCVQDDGCAEPDVIELTVLGHSLAARHRNATYNCCLDDITVDVTVQPNWIRFDEVEQLTQPCYCVCCYTVEACIVDLPPGRYTVEYWWFDYELGALTRDIQEVEIH